jgi:anti-sigma factor RsiW
MNNCEYYEELISRSLDDELTIDERKELAVHLASCPKCSQLWQLMADISGMMEADMDELPEGLHENIMADIRRSEMKKKDTVAGSAGSSRKAKATVEKKISRPVRNLLATAACLAIVVAAAIGLNPADRAEDVVLERSSATAAQTDDSTEKAAPESTAAVEDAAPEETAVPTATAAPTAAPTTSQSVVSTPKPTTSGSNVIITTPAPTVDPYLSTSTPAPTTGSAVNRAATTTATPTPTAAPVQTPAPTVKPTAAPTQEPQTDNGENSQSTSNASKAAAASDEAENNTAEVIVNVAEKVAPTRIFSMLPSLSAISPEPAAEELDDEAQTADELEAEALVENDEAATEEPALPEPIQLDLMKSDKTDELVKLLVGYVDEDSEDEADGESKESSEIDEELAPEEAELPDVKWIDSYVIKMIYNDIPCELSIQTYENGVYFSFAELVIEPPAEDATGEGKTIEAPEPAPTPTAEPGPDVSSTPAPTAEAEQTDNAEVQQDGEQEFTPVWLLSKCTNKEFNKLMTSIMKELAKR